MNVLTRSVIWSNAYMICLITMNIFGTVKKIISCQIINSAKGYSLETGDIIQFSNTAGDMPVDPFGDNWADYYCIINLVRGLGTVKITAREVG